MTVTASAIRVEPAVVAAIVAALASHLGTAPEALAIRSVRPLAAAAPPSGAWPRPWAWAGRQQLMADRLAMLRRR